MQPSCKFAWIKQLFTALSFGPYLFYPLECFVRLCGRRRITDPNSPIPRSFRVWKRRCNYPICFFSPAGIRLISLLELLPIVIFSIFFNTHSLKKARWRTRSLRWIRRIISFSLVRSTRLAWLYPELAWEASRLQESAPSPHRALPHLVKALVH